MARVQGSIMDDREELIMSSLASIARLANRQHFYVSIGRYRASRSPMAFHKKNSATVKRYAKEISSPAHAQLAAEADAIIAKYE